jgi:hypothetical protein
MDKVAGIQDDFVGQDRRQGSREAHPISLSSAEDRRGATGAVGAVQGEARKESCIECFRICDKARHPRGGFCCVGSKTALGRDSFLTPAGH